MSSSSHPSPPRFHHAPHLAFRCVRCFCIPRMYRMSIVSQEAPQRPCQRPQWARLSCQLSRCVQVWSLQWQEMPSPDLCCVCIKASFNVSLSLHFLLSFSFIFIYFCENFNSKPISFEFSLLLTIEFQKGHKKN